MAVGATTGSQERDSRIESGTRRGREIMEKIIYIMRDYPEAVIFMCLVGIFTAGVYLGTITERQKWGN